MSKLQELKKRVAELKQKAENSCEAAREGTEAFSAGRYFAYDNVLGLIKDLEGGRDD